MISIKAFAYEIEAQNIDGVIIYYNFINNGTELEVTKGNSSYNGNVIIPEEITYMNKTYKVTSIGNEAFWNNTGLSSITFPNSIKRIGRSAFYHCASLKSINIPNNVTSIGYEAFSDCYYLEEVNLSQNLKEIAGKVFYHCALKSIMIPQSVTTIGTLAFQYCNFNSIEIPGNVTSIGSNAFENCGSLTAVILKEGIKSINSYAFAGCKALTSITIPKSVTFIGNNAFDGTSLTSVTSLIELPFAINGKTSNGRAFSFTSYENAILYVPVNTVDIYKSTEGWKDFVNIKEESGGGGTIIPEKCATPSIKYENGKLIFQCITEGVSYQYNIMNQDVKTGSAQEVQLDVTYIINVYATKAGYENSEISTAMLCWVEHQPKTEGITNEIAQVSARAIIVQSNSGVIDVQGVENDTLVSVYGINGILAGSAVSQAGAATINTNLQPGSIAIVKIGQKSVKVVVK